MGGLSALSSQSDETTLALAQTTAALAEGDTSAHFAWELDLLERRVH
jgi:hypothetical protein